MSKTLRLLQIEDSGGDADMILGLLTQAGFEVVSRRVEDGDGLREALLDPSWDVIIAEYSLAGFDAPAALHILHEGGHVIPLIIVSGRTEHEDVAVEMMKSGARDYLSKSNLKRLVPVVERELTGTRAWRESRETQQEWRSRVETMTLALEAGLLGTFDLSAGSGELIWSTVARQLFGVSTEAEVSFDTFVRTLHPADRERVIQALQNAWRYENGGEYKDEFRILRIDDGQERWISSRGRVLFDAQAQPVHLAGVASDTTEAKRREQQLLQTQRIESISRVAGGIAGDFNKLLTSINGFAHMVLADLTPGSPAREPMEELSKCAVTAANLARQLLTFSRPSAEPKTIRANEFISDYEKTLRRRLGMGIELVLSLDPTAGAFCADPVQIGQALLNLTANARDAMPNGGKLEIATCGMVVDEPFARSQLTINPGQYVVMTLTDTGMGISPEVKAHLFEPFYSSKGQGKGAGLGLPTVYAIVVGQSHGGMLVSSEQGTGTAVKLFFPALEVDAVSAPGDRAETVAASRETILLAEDEPAVRKYARGILERNGYVVLEAGNGVEALSLAHNHHGPIHMLLTDLIMPAMGGMELAEKFSADYPQVPVLFMSGYTDQIMRHWSSLSAYIQKPFALSGLLTQVRELLDGSAKPPA